MLAGVPAAQGPMQLSIVTWNINSVRLRLDLLVKFLRRHRPDVVCLQETKCPDASFPRRRLARLGYTHIECAGQKGYHGVATLARIPIVRLGCVDFNGTGHARHLAVAIPGANGARPLVVHNVYVPSGGDEPDVDRNPKFREKLVFLRGMADWFAAYGDWERARMILVGDLNVAPLETDVWSHRQLLRVVSHTPIEVEHLERLQRSQGWADIMRRHIPPQEKLFTWWSYRARNWRSSNRGRRLDHIWATPALASASKELAVLTEPRDWPRPSDHVPVLAKFDLSAP